MSDRRPATLLGLVLVLVLVASLVLPSAALAHIRLAGQFAMTGRLTAARAVPGEHVGETVSRTWNFLAPCPQGQCLTEGLVRSRAVGGDTTTIRRSKITVFSRWRGEGSFFAPLMCGARVYRLGERVSFRITVQITGAAVIAGATVATAVRATYESYRRTNLTRCVGALGHDAAVYTGTLLTPAPTPAPVPLVPTRVPG